MKTITLEEAVKEVINDFLSRNLRFSAHEATVAIRNKVNSKQIEIVGIPVGFVDSANPHSQIITHADVRDEVLSFVASLNLDVDYSSGYRVFGAQSTTTSRGGGGINSILGIGVGAMAVPPITGVQATIAPAVTAPAITTIKAPALVVPQRFTHTVKDDAKARVTRYIRGKLDAGVKVTIRNVQSAVKSKLTVTDIEAVVKAEGWQLDTTAGARSNFVITK